MAGVRSEARHAHELIRRLRRDGYPPIAFKVERALGTRTVHVDFNALSVKRLFAPSPIRSPPFSELYAVLLTRSNGDAPKGASLSRLRSVGLRSRPIGIRDTSN